MKNGKAVRNSEAAQETGANMTTDLVNQIIVEGIIAAEQDLSTTENCNKRRGDSFKRGN